jgi:pimeloyl-ACP methyl ester carboxylesterase
VLVHNGTPNSRQLYAPHVADAAARGIRLISYDRPGYGESSPQPGRNVASCADDVRAICAALGIERLATWGVSGGGPHVLACAALLPDLVAAAASLASPAPQAAEGLDWFAGMGQENVDDFKLVLKDPVAARAKAANDREGMLSASPADLHTQFATLLTPTDAAVMTGQLAEYLSLCAWDGLAPGIEGWAEDGLALAYPWGFSVSDITVPVLLMHGREDQFVPFGHGEWLAAHIPGVDARLLDHDGHLTLGECRIGEVHDWLLSRL